MTGWLRSIGALLLFISLMFKAGSALAHSPVDFLEVLMVKPSQTIVHGVETKSRFDSKRTNTSLEGPVYFSRSVGAMNRNPKSAPAYLNWFAIKEAVSEPERTVEVLDMVRGASDKRLQTGNAAFLLSPAQLISSGVPDEVPEGLDLYKAYRIVKADAVDLKLDLVGSVGARRVAVGKPVLLCLPTDQWHHDETVLVSHPNDCFVVYELKEQSVTPTFSTIDQFGINELKASKIRWLCVRAAFLRETTR